ncbi:MAG: penicillin-binding protein 2 [Pseudomonadales bacterium]
MSWRHHFLALAFLGGTVLLGYRVVDLMVVQRPLLQAEAAKRSDRMERMPARRGVIRDRWGEPLAISTPVYKIFAEPKYMKANAVVKPAQARALAQVLALDGDDLERRLNDRRIGYTLLARQVEWNAAQRVRALEIPGVRLETTYRRYYPAGEVAVQVVGFMGQVRDADSDRESLAPVEEGRGGIELAFNDRLRMQPGIRRVVRDRDSHNIDDLGVVTQPKDGEDVTLSIDLRLQYQAYRELKAACAGHDAASGSLVMLDARTGEILALANQPSLNPNQPLPADLAGLANAAIIAPLEPGSTAKPFTAIAGLESGKFSPDSEFDTNPGYFQAGRLAVKDPVNYRTLSLTGVLKKSSQVGIVKLAMQLDRDATYSVLKRVGFGSRTGSGLPAEHSGLLDARRLEREVDV